ncbi:MAG TPA: TetR/AcrR family transcriptional regulator [Acidimicrobiales bacterium]|nr:TetR/AcrR family transcriptional regulator [Acidimicrobiales bacterium]
MVPTTRMHADERREQVLGAAMAVFAHDGYEGTSTEDVAKAAGISQPYLFRLFDTKKALFIAMVERGFGAVGQAFRQAADGLTGEPALEAMGDAYGQLLANRDLLRIQLHAYAASEDPDIRAVTRRSFADLWRLVTEISELPEERIVLFFAKGMLLNVIAAMDATDLGEAWVRACLRPDGG